MYIDFNKVIDSVREFYDEFDRKVSFDASQIDLMIAGALIRKIYNGSSASILLMNKDLYIESSYVIRTILESLLILVSLSKHREDTIKRLEDNHLLNGRKLVKNIRNLDVYEDIRHHFDEIDYDNEDMDDRHETSIFTWAEQADLVELYRFAYKGLCTESHTNLLSLESEYKIKNDVVMGYNFEQTPDEFNRRMYTLVYIMVEAVKATNRIFDLNEDSRISQIFEEFELIVKSSKGSNGVI